VIQHEATATATTTTTTATVAACGQLVDEIQRLDSSSDTDDIDSHRLVGAGVCATPTSVAAGAHAAHGAVPVVPCVFVETDVSPAEPVTAAPAPAAPTFDSFGFWREPPATSGLDELLAQLGLSVASATQPNTLPAFGSTLRADGAVLLETETETETETPSECDAGTEMATIKEVGTDGDASAGANVDAAHALPTEQTLDVPTALVVFYTKMALAESAIFIDIEAARDCAFSFPAVLWAIGKPGWLVPPHGLISPVNFACSLLPSST
jgi:hypothetical protein